MDFKDLESVQDEIVFRRLVALWLQEQADKLRELLAAMPGKIPWYVPSLATVLVAGMVGYIGIVHTLALRNSARIDNQNAVIAAIKETQDRRSSLTTDVEDLKRRVGKTEEAAGQLPYIKQALDDIRNTVNIINNRGRQGSLQEIP